MTLAPPAATLLLLRKGLENFLERPKMPIPGEDVVGAAVEDAVEEPEAEDVDAVEDDERIGVDGEEQV